MGSALRITEDHIVHWIPASVMLDEPHCLCKAALSRVDHVRSKRRQWHCGCSSFPDRQKLALARCRLRCGLVEDSNAVFLRARFYIYMCQNDSIVELE